MNPIVSLRGIFIACYGLLPPVKHCSILWLQVGKVVSGPAEFYSSRVPRRQRKTTIMDELLHNHQFRRSVPYIIVCNPHSLPLPLHDRPQSDPFSQFSIIYMVLVLVSNPSRGPMLLVCVILSFLSDIFLFPFLSDLTN